LKAPKKRPSGPPQRDSSVGLSSSAHSAGVKVSATIAEIATDTARLRANWR
jgi:hypothetical protein